MGRPDDHCKHRDMGEVTMTNAIAPEDHPTILGLACDFFKSSPDQELYEAVRNASPTQLQEFLECYRVFGSQGRLKAPLLEPGMLRPYLRTDRTDTAYWALGSFD